MRELIEEVLALQSEWTSKPTALMVRRGQIVLHEIPAQIRTWLPTLATLVPGATDDLRVDASDGAGAKAKVPWTRIFSAKRSPGASEGWYVVLLFSAVGGAAYLSINQGSTRWDHGNFDVPRTSAELVARADWARGIIGGLLASRPELLPSIDMEVGASDLGARYEAGNVTAFRYAAGSVPDAATIEADLRVLVGALGTIYLADEESLQLPGDPAPEVADAVEAAVRQASPLRRRARVHMSHAERVAVEMRAVAVAKEWLENEGYTKVQHVGDKKSHDIDAHLGDLHLFVEVKGTTSAGLEVVLTKNEVEVYGREHPATMLIVVTGIHLDRKQTPPVAAGGQPRCIYPWAIEEARLTPISYRYTVPSQQPGDASKA